MSRFVDAVESSGVSYQDLLGDLLRYGGRATAEAEWRLKYPTISDELIVAAASTADECPLCLSRFIYLGPRSHRLGCHLADVLGPGPGRQVRLAGVAQDDSAIVDPQRLPDRIKGCW